MDEKDEYDDFDEFEAAMAKFPDFDPTSVSSKMGETCKVISVSSHGHITKESGSAQYFMKGASDIGAKGPASFVKGPSSSAKGPVHALGYERVMNRDAYQDIRETHDAIYQTLVQDPSMELLISELKKNGIDEDAINKARLEAKAKDLLSAHEPLQLAMYMYTLSESEISKGGEKYQLHKGLNESLVNSTHEWEQFATHLLSGLKLLPYEWETVYRGMQMYGDINLYTPGEVIMWSAFTSTSLNPKVAKGFAARAKKDPIIFTIHALSGRFIKDVSKFPSEEEVLIPPITLFEVEKRKIAKSKDQMTHVTLREIHMARGNKCLLWVDDNHENNKALMEQTESIRKDVNMVMLNTTEDAIKFLKKDENYYLRQRNLETFRIITDMTRANDHEAGAKFIRRLREEINYDHCVMVFCGDLQRARESLLKHKSKKPGKTIATTQVKACLKFATFE